MMKLRIYFLSVLCGLMMVAGFSSCSDDNDSPSWKEGAKIDLPSYRAFVLSEGSYGKNNSHLFFLDPAQDTTYTSDIFEAQNGVKVGDTANDLITYNGDLYLVVDVSKYLVRLNGAGVVQARYSDFSKLGEPRSAVADDGKLYVTCYGGYVARFNAETLAFEDTVKVDANPEQIIAYGGNLYCVNSGYGKGHTMSIINEKKFDKAESVETLSNPQCITEANGHIYVSAYGIDYSYPIAMYNASTKTFTQIGKGMKMVAYGDKLYFANSTSKDWVNYTTYVSSYDASTGTIAQLKVPTAISTGNVYLFERNPYDGTFYMATTDFYSNGKLYHLDNTLNRLKAGPIDAGGINPNSMVFLK
jgi:hypothetical protein